MSEMVYYNENDEEKAAWLRELIRENVIADGKVDERRIEEVEAADLRGFTQCHFFAGIGVWSYALRLAGFPDDRPVWTGSCPCPSFSAAGKGEGFDDPRHLWPAWSRLIGQCRPPTLFGEQADDAIGYGWLDLVQTDLERAHYAVGKAVLTAAGVGAPHARERLYFVAHAADSRQRGNSHAGAICEGKITRAWSGKFERFRSNGGMANADSKRRREARTGESAVAAGKCRNGSMADSDIVLPEQFARPGARPSSQESGRAFSEPSGPGATRSMGHASGTGLQERECDGRIQQQTFFAPKGQAAECGSYVNSFWRNADWVLRKRWNRDDWEWCPTEPGTFPLVTGAANRVLKLRGYGDAIVPQVAAAFIEADLDLWGA